MPRRIIGTVFQSLDGVMQAPGGPTEDPTGGFDLGGWQMGFADEEAGEAIGDSLVPPYALLLGRRTYDIFASYWPFVEGEPADIGKTFTAAEKFVLTHSQTPLEWENSHRVRKLDELAAIKQGDGPDLQIWGSGSLYSGLLERGLLDRLTLLTYPVVLGKGKRLFRDGTPPTTFRLTSGRVTSRGTAITVLEPAGSVALGNPPDAPANSRQDARQRRIAEGTW